MSSYGAGIAAGPQSVEPSFFATAWEAVFAGSMVWIASLQPSTSNT